MATRPRLRATSSGDQNGSPSRIKCGAPAASRQRPRSTPGARASGTERPVGSCIQHLCGPMVFLDPFPSRRPPGPSPSACTGTARWRGGFDRAGTRAATRRFPAWRRRLKRPPRRPRRWRRSRRAAPGGTRARCPAGRRPRPRSRRARSDVTPVPKMPFRSPKMMRRSRPSVSSKTRAPEPAFAPPPPFVTAYRSRSITTLG